MSDLMLTVINTLAKVPHDAFHIVAKHGDNMDAEVREMQLLIGLGGKACSVPFKRGMSMAELRQEVSRATGIPVNEQVYIASDASELVDIDGKVPTERPPLCLWTRTPEAKHAEQVAPGCVSVLDDSSAAALRDSSGESSTQIDRSAAEVGSPTQRSSCDPAGADKAAALAATLGAKHGHETRAKWADLAEMSDESEVQTTWPDVPFGETQQPSPAQSESGSLWETPLTAQQKEAGRGKSWAWEFTQRWRQWSPSERQHQFYIAIADESYLEEHKVAKQIRQACGNIYKEGQIMVRLRGHGSGFLEVKWHGQQWESSDPLMICLSGRVPYDLDAYWEAFYRIASLLEDEVYAAHNALAAADEWTGRAGARPCGRWEVHLEDGWVNAGRRDGGRKSAAPRARLGC